MLAPLSLALSLYLPILHMYSILICTYTFETEESKWSVTAWVGVRKEKGKQQHVIYGSQKKGSSLNVNTPEMCVCV